MQATTTYESKRFFAQRFALWVAIASMSMMFAGLTSAYIVKKADIANWTNFSIPLEFYFSTAIILLSSVTMHFAYRSFKLEQLKKYFALLLITLLLGVAFVLFQLAGWMSLNNAGFSLTNEISGSFFYVISGTHATHVIGGLLILLISLFSVRKKIKDPISSLTLKFTPRRIFKVELVMTYWHFVDALWIYIFLFLLYNHS